MESCTLWCMAIGEDVRTHGEMDKQVTVQVSVRNYGNFSADIFKERQL